jgi:hypothetical protein
VRIDVEVDNLKKLFRAVVALSFLITWTTVLGGPISAARLATPAADHLRRQTVSVPSLEEEFSFSLKDFKIDHQGEINTLNLTVKYRYKVGITVSDYPDFRLIAKDVESFLSTYPNKKDYWEILNKQLTSLILRKYPSIAQVSSELQVLPSANVPYLRSSTVIRQRNPNSERSTTIAK